MSALKPLKKTATKRPQARRAATPSARSPLPIFYAIFALIVVVGVVALALRARAGTPLGPSNVPVTQAVRTLTAPTGQTTDGYWYKGPDNAPVTVIEFGDFQCPSCGAAFQLIEGKIDQSYVETGKITFVYHDFPLPQHKNAVPAAQAARAAGAQGKFWAMHDLLYARQGEWQDDSSPIARFKSYAAELGLDQTAFDQTLDSQQYAPVINAAITDGTRQGINATPTYLVDGESVDANGLGAAIDAALRAKGP